jgi:AMP deaminase
MGYQSKQSTNIQAHVRITVLCVWESRNTDDLSCTVTMPPEPTPEFRSMLELLRKCLDLRDKYISVSNQRLGDNPRDHDSVFHGIAEGISDVMGVRPEATGSYETVNEQFKPWHIYPRPPPPHWHWTADQAVSSPSTSRRDGFEFFDFTQFEIPSAHEWGFEIDNKGVYQVYHDATGMFFPACGWFFCLINIQP